MVLKQELDEIKARLGEFEITGATIRRKDMFGFSYFNEEKEERGVFVLLPNSQNAKWGTSVFGKNLSKITISSTFFPKEQWIAINKEGGVFVSGSGDPGGFKKPITNLGLPIFTNIKCIAKGRAYAITSWREVFRRDDDNTWVNLNVPVSEHEEKNSQELNFGLDDIDGFKETDIYTAGFSGDAWHYDGNHWQRMDLPVNDDITSLVCASDGYVYMTTWFGHIIKGKYDTKKQKQYWEVINKTIGEHEIQQLEASAWYKGRLYVSTWQVVYYWNEDKKKLVPLIEDSAMRKQGYSQLFGGFLATGDGVLLTAGPSEAHLYDGEKWMKLI